MISKEKMSKENYSEVKISVELKGIKKRIFDLKKKTMKWKEKKKLELEVRSYARNKIPLILAVSNRRFNREMNKTQISNLKGRNRKDNKSRRRLIKCSALEHQTLNSC